MTTTTHTPTVRRDGIGHVVTVPGRERGREIRFDALLDHGEELVGVAIWGHDLTAAEALWRARAYLEEPYPEDFEYDPAVEWGQPDWRDAWPGVDADLSRHVRRAWGRWRVLAATDPEVDQHGTAEPGDHWFVESDGPGDGLKPVTVVSLVAG